MSYLPGFLHLSKQSAFSNIFFCVLMMLPQLCSLPLAESFDLAPFFSFPDSPEHYVDPFWDIQANFSLKRKKAVRPSRQFLCTIKRNLWHRPCCIFILQASITLLALWNFWRKPFKRLIQQETKRSQKPVTPAPLSLFQCLFFVPLGKNLNFLAGSVASVQKFLIEIPLSLFFLLGKAETCFTVRFPSCHLA